MRLVLCDDHELLLESLRFALEREGHRVVATASSPGDGVVAVARHRPDVCLLDLSFPEGSGLAVVPELRRVSPETTVVVLSGQCGEAVHRAVRDAGARALLRKDQPFAAIAQALVDVEQGVPTSAPGTAERATAARGRTAGRPERDDVGWLLRFLTAREREVLRRILDGETTDEMAAGMGVAASTTRTHVQGVLQKLGVNSRLQAAARVARDALDEAQRLA